MRRLLRLWVMTKINYSEEYIKGAIRSSQTDITKLNHRQLSAYRTTLKQIEADLMIDMAFDKGKLLTVEDVDCSVFKPAKD